MTSSKLLHSTKYDGSLHYHYDMQIVQQEADVLALYCPVGTPIDCYRGQFPAKHHSLEWYWPDRDWNLSVIWYADWRPRMHYVNIATPATWDDQKLHFIDLDLDVIWRAATDEVLLDDEDEFLVHRERFQYPQELIDRCWRACDEVRDLMARRVFPFDGSLLNWRPHALA